MYTDKINHNTTLKMLIAQKGKKKRLDYLGVEPSQIVRRRTYSHTYTYTYTSTLVVDDDDDALLDRDKRNMTQKSIPKREAWAHKKGSTGSKWFVQCRSKKKKKVKWLDRFESEKTETIQPLSIVARDRIIPPFVQKRRRHRRRASGGCQSRRRCCGDVSTRDLRHPSSRLAHPKLCRIAMDRVKTIQKLPV